MIKLNAQGRRNNLEGATKYVAEKMLMVFWTVIGGFGADPAEKYLSESGEKLLSDSYYLQDKDIETMAKCEEEYRSRNKGTLLVPQQIVGMEMIVFWLMFTLSELERALKSNEAEELSADCEFLATRILAIYLDMQNTHVTRLKIPRSMKSLAEDDVERIYRRKEIMPLEETAKRQYMDMFCWINRPKSDDFKAILLKDNGKRMERCFGRNAFVYPSDVFEKKIAA